MNKKKLMLLCLVLLGLWLSACGSDRDGDNNNDNDHPPGPTPAPYIDGGVTPYTPDGEATQHLQIAAHPHTVDQIRVAVRQLAADMATRGVTLTYHINVYATGYFDSMGRRHEHFRSFTGVFEDYDIIHTFDPGLLASLGEAGQLADIRTLIRQDPYLTEQDFFMEVLEVNARDSGHIYSTPLGFTMEMIGVNVLNDERWLVQFFAERESVTLGEIFAYYFELRPAIDAAQMPRRVTNLLGATTHATLAETGSHSIEVIPMPHWHFFEHGMNHYQGEALQHVVASTLALSEIYATLRDRPIGDVRFDPTGRLLVDIRDASERIRTSSWLINSIELDFTSTAHERGMSNFAMFISTQRAGADPLFSFNAMGVISSRQTHDVHLLQALIGTPNGYFDHFVPLVTPQGELVVHAAPFGELAINAQGNTQMAWELFKRLPARLLAHSQGNFETVYHRVMPIPITRWHVEENLQHVMSRIMHAMYGLQSFRLSGIGLNPQYQGFNMPTREYWPQLTEEATARMMRYLDWGLAVTIPIPPAAYQEVFNRLLLGIYTPEVATTMLEINMEDWLARR